MKVVVTAFNQEKALVGAFSVITNYQMELFEALVTRLVALAHLVVPTPVVSTDRGRSLAAYFSS